MTGPGLPVAVYEFLVAPAALALAFRHARAALGARRAAGELLALAAYGFALERISMTAFGSHRYGAEWVARAGRRAARGRARLGGRDLLRPGPGRPARPPARRRRARSPPPSSR